MHFSYSRQNLLSHTKSNEDTETSRRAFLSSSQDRPPRDLPPPSQNNQSGAGALAQPAVGHGNSYSSSPHQILLPPSLNTQVNHHVQISRARLTDAPSHRNPAKNETRHQDNDSRTLILPHKNEASGLSRTGNSDSGSENIRSVRNDVNHSLQNTDNLNSSRNYSQSSRDHGNEDVAQGINKKGPERIRCRKEVLNNRGYGNT